MAAYNIAPCIHATFYLPIHHLVNIWVAFISWAVMKNAAMKVHVQDLVGLTFD